MAAELASGFTFLERTEKQEASCLASRAIDVLSESISLGWLLPIMQFYLLPVSLPTVHQPSASVGSACPSSDLLLVLVSVFFSMFSVSILYNAIDALTPSFRFINSLEI